MPPFCLIMKHFFIALGFVGIGSICLAQSPPSTQEITKQIIQTVTNYANTISCPGVRVEPKQIAALVPYTTFENRSNARYAVLWIGDIGCAGGSGTTGTHIAIVRVSTGNSFVVDTRHSSPNVYLESPAPYIDKIVGNTSDSLTLEGKTPGPNDPRCCPSIKTRFTLRVDREGNWRLIEKKALQ
jgi:hypothetical protein